MVLGKGGVGGYHCGKIMMVMVVVMSSRSHLWRAPEQHLLQQTSSPLQIMAQREWERTRGARKPASEGVQRKSEEGGGEVGVGLKLGGRDETGVI